MSWMFATAIFVGLTIVLGGPSSADSSQSVYSALLIAHGDWSCAYPPPSFSHLAGGFSLTFASPVYTLVSAGAARLLDIGSAVPFPSLAHLGDNCSHAMVQVANWTQSTGALSSMLRLGFIAWFVLAWGLVAVMRACDGGRNGWEAATLVAVACSAPVVACVEAFFHPEDVMAMGLILLTMASVLRERWLMVGAFIGLGVITQLFVILAVIPVALVLPRERRVVFVAGFVGIIALVVTPLAIVTSGRVLHWVFLGTSRAGVRGVVGAGGTVLFSAGLHGVALFLLARIAPVLAAVLLAWSAIRRWGARMREPVLLVSLVGTSLTLRLVFEVNAFGYYYMAAVVSLLLLDALRGRFRGESFALIWLITLAYSPVAWGFQWRGQLAGPYLRALLPYVVSLPIVIIIVVSLIHHRLKWYLVAWQALVVGAFLRFPLPVDHYRSSLPLWCWQLLLVTPLMYLLSAPLREVRPQHRGEVAVSASGPRGVDR